MNFFKLKHRFAKHIANIPGWRTNRKIVVFESDDWGSIRTKSAESLDVLKRKGFEVDKCHYMQNDSLASDVDLDELFNLLLSFKDFKGNHPIITANCLVANPDFKKIEESSFEKYHFESFKTTLNNYPKHQNSFSLWEKGMQQKIFHPQFHGREHLNIERWMVDLQNKNEETLFGFHIGMFGISGHITKVKRGSYLAAFDGGENENRLYNKQDIVKEGLSLFKQEFGYNSKSFIAPNYVWNEQIEKVASEGGVKFIQGTNTQRISSDYDKKKQLKRHYLGQRSKNEQIYLTRNCFFEPSENQNKSWVDSCLREIDISFRWRKPAIISTHRVNFIGFINPINRDLNLPQFEQLLSEILKKWPDVEFMTSDKLGDLITENG